MSFLHKPTVLVLNRAWQAIGTRTVQDAIGQIMNGSMTVLDVQEGGAMVPVRWNDWIGLPVRAHDQFIRTVRGHVRVPTVMVSARFDRVPTKRPKFSSRAVRERDGHRCQYTGEVIPPGQGSMDHVIPLSRGGGNGFDNVVYARKDVNHRKADRTPEEAGLKLLRPPTAPKAVPISATIRNPGVADWLPFLS